MDTKRLARLVTGRYATHFWIVFSGLAIAAIIYGASLLSGHFEPSGKIYSESLRRYAALVRGEELPPRESDAGQGTHAAAAEPPKGHR